MPSGGLRRNGIAKYNLKTSIEDTMAGLAHLIEILQATPIPKIVLNSYELIKIKASEGISLITRLRIALYFYARFREYKDSASLFPRLTKSLKNWLLAELPWPALPSQKPNIAREVLEQFGSEGYFKQIFGFNEVTKTKPDPEGILKLMEIFNIKNPQQVVYIGDMLTDIEAGLAAKVKTIAVGSGLVSKDKLQIRTPHGFY